MSITRHTMTDEQRKSVALDYFKSMDNGGLRADGPAIHDPAQPDRWLQDGLLAG